MIFCDFLTGFLGSGKTTLLNKVLSTGNPQRFAIVVNEFGEVGLDQWVYSQLSDNVYLLDSGCLCCTITHSLRETLMEIHHYSTQKGLGSLMKVVIESSGLADPLPSLHALIGDPVLKPYFQLGAVVTTMDAMNAFDQLDAYPESVRQVMAADFLVMTKKDLASTEQFEVLGSRLRDLNPFATLIDAHEEDLVFSIFNETQNASFNFIKALRSSPNVSSYGLQLGGNAHYIPLAKHSSNTNSWARFIDNKPTWPGLSAWWEIIKNEYGVRLLRCKGMVSMLEPASHVMIHGVGNHFHSPTPISIWPDSDTRGRLVCIGIGLDCDFLDASLLALTLKETYAKPKNLIELYQLLDL